MDEKSKYEKVWRESGRYGKDWFAKSSARGFKKRFTLHATPAARVTDFGCGNGTSLKWLESCGYVARGIDIAHNAVKMLGNAITIGDLRNAEDVGRLAHAEFGMCTDLMEHIPTHDVPAVIKNISSRISHGVLFSIARQPDLDGKPLGLVLHLTLKDKEWWDAAFLKNFKQIETLVYNENHYVFWAWKKYQDRSPEYNLKKA